jgi:hypothetical protein
MKRIIVFCIALLLLVGCGGKEPAAPQVQMDQRASATAAPAAATAAPETVAIVTAATEVPAETAPTAEPAPANSAESDFVDSLVVQWMTDGLMDDMYPLTAEDALDYYGIDFSACKAAVAFGDAVGYVNEAVVVAAEGAVLDEVEALLRDHLQAVKDQFRGYDAEALALAEKAVLIREGNMVLFVISPNAEAMTAVYRRLAA